MVGDDQPMYRAATSIGTLSYAMISSSVSGRLVAFSLYSLLKMSLFGVAHGHGGLHDAL